jgi:hypothetical protein
MACGPWVPTVGSMHVPGRRVWSAVTATLVVGATASVASVMPGTSEDRQPTARTLSSRAWSSVTRICAHALLCEGRHEIGTLTGAVAVARDIRSSTERRPMRVKRLSAAGTRRDLVRRWVALERRLAATYASSYVRIYEVIAATRTPRQHAREPHKLGRLLNAPDRLSVAAARLEQQLSVPDCTGGTPVAPSVSPDTGGVE